MYCKVYLMFDKMFNKNTLREKKKNTLKLQEDIFFFWQKLVAGVQMCSCNFKLANYVVKIYIYQILFKSTHTNYLMLYSSYLVVIWECRTIVMLLSWVQLSSYACCLSLCFSAYGGKKTTMLKILCSCRYFSQENGKF